MEDNIKEKMERLESERGRLHALLDFSHNISTRILNLDELLKLIMAEVRQILDADRCTVFLRDFDTDTLWSKIADGLGENKLTLPVGKGIVGAVAQTGEMINIKDAYADSRFNTEVDKKTGYKTKTILACPMKNKNGETIGVFQVLNRRNGVFEDDDEKFLILLAREAADAIENAFLYEEQKKMFESFIETLSVTLDRRDAMTAGHSKRVTYFAQKTGEKLALLPHELELLKYSSWMHDMGKIGVAEAILTKDGRLDEEEFSKMKQHAQFTREILENIYFKKEFRAIPKIASSHHENMDGSGYPDRLKGDALPFFSRIIAVCDVFDAITSRRHYRSPMPILGVLDILKNDTGTKFDASCTDAFFRIGLPDILRGINLGKDELFVITGEDGEILKKYSLGDFYMVLKTEEPTAVQRTVIETFGRYYAK